MRVLIGITCDYLKPRFRLNRAYADCVLAAGGVPLLLPPAEEFFGECLDRLDGVLLTGGGDIDTRAFNVPLHAKADLMDPRRQCGELALLKALDQRPDMPVLGICLGMQLMGLHAGGSLIQHLPDVVPGSECHQADRLHGVKSEFGNGGVTSSHHQALAETGRLQATGHAPDGVIEAVRDSARRFYAGVQWHPERTTDRTMGLGVIRALVAAAEESRR